MRRFAPVPFPEGARTDRASMTLLRLFDRCERSAYLYLKHDGGPQSIPMRRGSAFHRVIQLLIEAMVENGEQRVPPELAKAFVDEVLADPAYPCPIEEHDLIREMTYRWADETTLDPASVIACETLFVLDVAGVQVRAKVDLALLSEGGAVVSVKDWKTARALPSFEEMARRRRDGSLAAKTFQLVLYGLAVAFGRPVRIETQTCPRCGGEGVLMDEEGWPNCPDCEDHPVTGEAVVRVEVVEPFGLADRAQRFDLEYVYPGIETKDGKMATRPVSLTRLKLEEYRASLGALVQRFRAAAESGDWPALPGSHCSECPAESECPIPRELRGFAGAVNTPEEAAVTAEIVDRQKAWTKAVEKELREWVKAHGPLRFGADQVLEFAVVESDEIRDKEAMWADVQRAVDYGEPFDRAKHVRHKTGSRYRQRTLSAAEIDGSEGSR